MAKNHFQFEFPGEGKNQAFLLRDLRLSTFVKETLIIASYEDRKISGFFQYTGCKVKAEKEDRLYAQIILDIHPNSFI